MEPQTPDMSGGMAAIRSALQRRQDGGTPPAVAQQMPATGATPTGGPNVPQAGIPQPVPQGQAPQQNVSPDAAAAKSPEQEESNKSVKALVNLLGAAQVDPETKELSKQLVTKLLQYH